MAETRSPTAGTDPAAWVRSWTSAFAPQNLVQPILPGWTFNINSNNSSAPQTEAEVVQRHSYGRQLGRIADALSALIEAAGPALRKDGRCVDFLEMTEQIDTVKQQAAVTRIERLRGDLDLLKLKDPEEFRRQRDALRRTLDGML